MTNKKFIVQYTGTGQGVSRSVVELPIDEKLEGRALDTKIRALAEMKIKKSNRRDRGTIRIISIKPYNDSAEDSMDDKITSIAAKYGHEIRNSSSNKPNDPLANGNAKRLREIKALVLQDLRSIEAYVKKINDVKVIRNQIERIYPRMIGYLK